VWLREVSEAGEKSGTPPELHDAPGEQVGVPELFVRMLQNFARHGEPRNAADRRAHDLVEAVAQHAHQLRREGVVEQLQHQPPVAFVPIGDGAVVELRAGAGANGVEVEREDPGGAGGDEGSTMRGQAPEGSE
jgi:hypothetical protein